MTRLPLMLAVMVTAPPNGILLATRKFHVPTGVPLLQNVLTNDVVGKKYTLGVKLEPGVNHAGIDRYAASVRHMV